MFLTLSFGTFIGFFITGAIAIFIRSNNRMRIVFSILVIILIVVSVYIVLFIKDYQFEEYPTRNLHFQDKIILIVKFKLVSSGSDRLDHYKISINAFLPDSFQLYSEQGSFQ